MPSVNKQQIANALTMIFPLMNLIKHRGKRCNLKKIMYVHIPISFLLHSVSAFTNNKKVLGPLKKTDYFLIHLSSVVAAMDIKKRVHFYPLVHLAIWIMSARQHKDMHLSRSLLMLYEHKDMKYDRKHVITGVTSTLLFNMNNKIPYSHALFHISLFWIYDIYFNTV